LQPYGVSHICANGKGWVCVMHANAKKNQSPREYFTFWTNVLVSWHGRYGCLDILQRERKGEGERTISVMVWRKLHSIQDDTLPQCFVYTSPA
jgi:hypothetical protein